MGRRQSFWELRNPSPSIASNIVTQLSGTDSGYIAVTLGGGYAMPYRGDRLLFTPGREVESKRNEKGRVTSAVFEYKDGSQIRFTWSEQTGGKYHVNTSKMACAA